MDYLSEQLDPLKRAVQPLKQQPHALPCRVLCLSPAPSVVTLTWFHLAKAASVSCPAGDVAYLIEALAAANTQPAECHEIHLAAGTYTLTEVDHETDGPTGLPSIRGHIKICGVGSTSSIITRDPNAPEFRFFHVAATGYVILEHLSITGGGFTENGEIVEQGGALYNMASLRTSCMQGLEASGRGREGVPRGRLRRLQAPRPLGWLPLKRRAVAPGARLLAVAPAPRTRVPLRSRGRHAHQAHGCRPGAPLGGLGAAGGPPQARQARRHGLRAPVEDARHSVRRPIGPCAEAPLAWPRRDGAIAVAPREDGRHAPHRRHATGGQAPAAKRPSPEAPVVWAAHPERPRGWRAPPGPARRVGPPGGTSPPGPPGRRWPTRPARGSWGGAAPPAGAPRLGACGRADWPAGSAAAGGASGGRHVHGAGAP
jgi:hypothetical protein